MRNPSKVVLVGQAPLCFDHPDDAEVWVINGPRFPPRWDVLFQLHGLHHLETKHGEAFVDFLRGFRCLSPAINPFATGPYEKTRAEWHGGAPDARLIMTRTYEDISAAEEFPLVDVIRHLSGHTYLSNSFALCIAYASLIGVQHLMLDGVMFVGGPAQWGAGEGWAVPCIEYHIGAARARGMQVVVPRGVGLFECDRFIYGFEGPGSV